MTGDDTSTGAFTVKWCHSLPGRRWHTCHDRYIGVYDYQILKNYVANVFSWCSGGSNSQWCCCVPSAAPFARQPRSLLFVLYWRCVTLNSNPPRLFLSRLRCCCLRIKSLSQRSIRTVRAKWIWTIVQIDWWSLPGVVVRTLMGPFAPCASKVPIVRRLCWRIRQNDLRRGAHNNDMATTDFELERCRCLTRHTAIDWCTPTSRFVFDRWSNAFDGVNGLLFTLLEFLYWRTCEGAAKRFDVCGSVGHRFRGHPAEGRQRFMQTHQNIWVEAAFPR